MTIEKQIQQPSIQDKIKLIEQELQTEICSDIPNAFWTRKQHIISFPYKPEFNEKNIPTRSHPS